MGSAASGTPLFALSAVGLDLETTSLDAEQARIVQVGALRMDGDALDTAQPFERIVNPQVPIPPSTIAIHGITDAAAGAAPPLAAAWPAFCAFLGQRVLIGHSLGYDLTVLEREAARYRLSWRKPRSLCVRLLASIVVPTLHDPSLDRLAAWFEIAIEGRHSALGDAEAAARIFHKMVPLLAERGIRTLAEAERASLGRVAQLRQMSEAKWVPPVVDPAQETAGPRAGYDTYVYRHRIADAMAREVAVVGRSATLKQAMDLMAERAISSVLVADEARAGQPIAAYAILTERDVLRQIVKHGAPALALDVAAIASAPVRSIRETAFVYRAIARMRRLRYRHLAVTSETGELNGIVSARDLLKLRDDPAIELDDAIKEAKDAGGIAVAWARLSGVVQSLIAEDLDGHAIAGLVSEELRVVTERAAALAERSMADDGHGAPPCPFAVLLLGSGGRGESLLKPDQDNAIVFASGDPDGPEDRWFAELGARMATTLDQAGIPLCQGGVMAKNAQWRGDVATWQHRIDGWIGTIKPENLLNVDIFFDQRPVYGDLKLGLDLFAYAYAAGSRNAAFPKFLGSKLDQPPNALTTFGRVRTEEGRLDLKLHLLFPVVAAARTLAIRHNIAVHATKARLGALAEMGRGDVGLIQDLVADHEWGLSMLLEQQAIDVRCGVALSNRLDVGRLERRETARLKSALGHVQLIPSLVRDLMYG
jgi:DNA polymerase-3 subunit epsilon/CBS domain-containing protein